MSAIIRRNTSSIFNKKYYSGKLAEREISLDTTQCNARDAYGDDLHISRNNIWRAIPTNTSERDVSQSTSNTILEDDILIALYGNIGGDWW